MRSLQSRISRRWPIGIPDTFFRKCFVHGFSECQGITVIVLLRGKIAAHVSPPVGQKPVVGIQIHGSNHTGLFKIVDALNAPCLFPRIVQCGKQHSGENRNNRNHYEKFYQCETEPHEWSFRCFPRHRIILRSLFFF